MRFPYSRPDFDIKQLGLGQVMLSLCLILMSLLSCQQQTIHGLDDQLTPLAELKLSVNKSALESLSTETRSRLRFGLVWLSVNIPSSWCADKLSSILLGEAFSSQELASLTQLTQLCNNPLGVAPALAGPSVAIESESAVFAEDLITNSIIFTALPPSEVLIGTPDARVAYASLVIFEDLNDNGVLDLGKAFSPVFWDERGPRDRDDGPDEGSRRRFDEEENQADRLYSSSFTSLLDSHQRLVFREGQFTESYFYPLGGCVPPQGFSYLQVTGDFQEASCTASPIDTPLLLKLAEPSLTLQETICSPAEVWTFEPPQSELSEEYEYICISDTELAATDPEQNCKNLSIIQLVDCPSNQPDCDAQWDVRDTPPAWWPCLEEGK